MQPMDRNLLFAALAAKTQFVDRDALEQSLRDWDPNQEPQLSQKLVADGKLEQATVVAIDQVVDEHLRKHGGDASESLAFVQPDVEIARAFEQLKNWEISGVRPKPTKNPTLVNDESDGSFTAWKRFNRLIRDSGSSEFGRYRLVGPLARGGIGEVFRARDLELNRDVALKRIQNRLADESFFRERFLLEAEVTGALEHPNIVPVYGLNVDAKGQPYYAMRLIRGQSLAEHVADVYSLSRPLVPPRQTVRDSGEEERRAHTLQDAEPAARQDSGPISEANEATPQAPESGTVTIVDRDAPVHLLPANHASQSDQETPEAATIRNEKLAQQAAQAHQQDGALASDQDAAAPQDDQPNPGHESEADDSPHLGKDYDGHLRRLLYRFVSVCQAVHYAHSRGILHRDLKPENIMLGPYGETLVLDWGLAKVMDEKKTSSIASNENRARVTPDSNSEATPTMDGALIGTLAYMSPEQSLGWHDSLTPASDVYSLGATLYTVLTGQRSIRGVDIEDCLMRLQRSEFPEPRTLNRRIPRAVNAICLKAMSAAPSSRYATAKEMADDIEAFLADEPTVAYQEPLLAKTGRWSRKHRSITASFVVAAVLVSLSLGIGLILMSKARQTETRLKDQAISARNAANAYAQSTFDVVEKIVDSVTNDPELATEQMKPLRNRLLESVESTLETLTHEESNPAVALNRARAFQQLGHVHEQQGEMPEAQAAYLDALNLIEDLDVETKKSYPGRFLRVVSLSNLANQYERDHKISLRNEALSAAEKLLLELEAEYPDDFDVQSKLSIVYNNRATYAMDDGDLDKAEEELLATIALRRELLKSSYEPLQTAAELLGTYGNLSMVYGMQGEFDQQSEQLSQAIELAKEYVADQDDMPNLQSTYADLITKQADLQAQISDRTVALEYYDQALAANQRILDLHPNMIEVIEQRAMILGNLGGVLLSMSEFDRAADNYQQAIDALQNVRTLSPGRVVTRDRLATNRMNLASLELNRGNYDTADELLEKAVKDHEALRQEFPDEQLYQAMVGIDYSLLADLRSKQDRLDDALAASQMSIDTLDQLTSKHGNSVENWTRYATGLHQHSLIEARLNQVESAIEHVQQARSIRKRLIDEGRASVNVQLDYHASSLLFVSLLFPQGKVEESIDVLIDAAKGLERIAEQFPNNRDAPNFLFNVQAAFLAVLNEPDDFEKRLAQVQQKIDLTDESVSFDIRLGFAELLAQNGQLEQLLPLLDKWKDELESEPTTVLRSIGLYSLVIDACDSSVADATQAEAWKEEAEDRACELIELFQDQLNAPVDDIIQVFESDDSYTPLLESKRVMEFMESLR